MSDPFLPNNSHQQVVREAKIGFGVAFLIVAAVGTWSYLQYTKFRHEIPEHVQLAPVATHVGPDYYLRNLTNQTAESQSQEARSERSNVPPNNIPDSQLSRVSSKLEVGQRPELTKIEQTDQGAYDQPAVERTLTSKMSANGSQKLAFSTEDRQQPKPVEPQFVRTIDNEAIAPVVLQSVNPIKTPLAHDISTDFLLPRKDVVTAPQPSTLSDDGNEFVPSEPSSAFNQSRDPGLVQINSRSVSPEPVKATSYLQEDAEQFSDTQGQKAKLPSANEAISVEVNDPWRTSDAGPRNDLPQKKTDAFAVKDTARYQTHQGDSFWSIAQTSYQDGRFFRALYEHNRTVVDGFENIPVGSIIKTPPLEVLRSQYSTLCPQDSADQPLLDTGTDSVTGGDGYRTQTGDTLFEIARQTTGQASRYLEIIQLNREKLPGGVTHLTRLPADLILQLPE